MVTIIFLVCFGVLTYIYIGYPVLIWLLATFCSRTIHKGSVSPQRQCSVVIAAYHEGPVLLSKVESILNSSGLSSVREIVIGFDGPQDENDVSPEKIEAISRFRSTQLMREGSPCQVPEVRVFVFPERRGKAQVLNDLVPLTRGEILIMMDARQMIHAAAIGELLANFADEIVGVVSGELVFRNLNEESDVGVVQEGVGFYWRYEKFIRRCEGRYRSVPGATGALYGIRRRLFQPIPGGTLLDDVAIPMQAVMQGCRCIFEPAAEVFDVPSLTSGQESLRKRRTIAGVVQLMRLYPRWLLPWRNPIWFEFVSHKVLRLVSPILLVGLFLSNLWLLDHLVFELFFVFQSLFYLAALAGLVAQKKGWSAQCLGVPLMFVALNLTTALAIFDAARNRFNASWK